MESVDDRKKLLKEWLTTHCGLQSVCLQTELSGASFRRYFRIYSSDGSYIAMDAPPSKENCSPYIAIAKALQELGLKTPEIIRSDIQQGFLLISDFGDLTYLRMLNNYNAEQLYQNALNALSILQGCKKVEGHDIPSFTFDFMYQEWEWHKEWFLRQLLNVSYIEPELDQCIRLLLNSAVNQPQVFMHRDFHSANLMMLPKNEVGLLDFQDAFIGPITYDLVSLLKDCYIDWPEELINNWVLDYWQKLKTLEVLPNIKSTEFLRWFDLMGIQRHLKALFTFSRKYLRDQQSHYLEYIPRTLNYLLKTTKRYSELDKLYDFYQQIAQATIEKAENVCAP